MSAARSAVAGGAEAGKDAWDTFWAEVVDDQQMLKEDAAEYVRRLRSAIGFGPETRVLDFGCGFGNVARLLAPAVRHLSLWDDAPRMRRSAMAAVAGAPNVELVDLSTPSLEHFTSRFDLILANSVGQFMTAAELQTWFHRWRGMLAPGGQIVISDLVPPGYAAARDLWIMLRFSGRRGFILRALYDAARVMPLYWRTRTARPLLRTSEMELRQWAASASLAIRLLPENLTYFRDRIAAVLTLPASPV